MLVVIVEKIDITFKQDMLLFFTEFHLNVLCCIYL